MERGDYTPEFPLQWALKDVDLAIGAVPGRFLSVAAAGQVSPRSQAGLRRSYSNCAAMDSSLRGTFQCSAYNASCSGAILVFRSDRGIATP